MKLVLFFLILGLACQVAYLQDPGEEAGGGEAGDEGGQEEDAAEGSEGVMRRRREADPGESYGDNYRHHGRYKPKSLFFEEKKKHEKELAFKKDFRNKHLHKKRLFHEKEREAFKELLKKDRHERLEEKAFAKDKRFKDVKFVERKGRPYRDGYRTHGRKDNYRSKPGKSYRHSGY